MYKSCLTDTEYHLFADDKQVYISISPQEEAVGCRRLTNCITDLQSWCMSRRLQLNAAKTELICFGSQTTLRRSLPGAHVLTINDVVLQPFVTSV